MLSNLELTKAGTSTSVNSVVTREHKGTERDTEGVGQDMSMPLKLFLVSGSLFSETSAHIITSIRGS